MYIFKFFLLLLFVTQLASSTLDDIDKNLISNHFNNYVDQGKLPNISILITKDAEEIYRHVYGYSDIKNKKKAAKNTIYRIYSMTKPITGVAIMQLVEKGKIGVDQASDGQVFPKQVIEVGFRFEGEVVIQKIIVEGVELEGGSHLVPGRQVQPLFTQGIHHPLAFPVLKHPINLPGQSVTRELV